MLEQEKREQEKQLQNQPGVSSQEEQTPVGTSSEQEQALLSDHDFEKLKADVFSSGQLGGLASSAPQCKCNVFLRFVISSLVYYFAAVPTSTISVSNPNRNAFMNRLSQASMGNQWQTSPSPARPSPSQTPVQMPTEVAPRIPTFTANLLPAPPLPPEHVVTEQDKQAQLVYEQWLKHQSGALNQQLKFYETEVQKLRKMRKVSCLNLFVSRRRQ